MERHAFHSAKAGDYFLTVKDSVTSRLWKTVSVPIVCLLWVVGDALSNETPFDARVKTKKSTTNKSLLLNYSLSG